MKTKINFLLAGLCLALFLLPKSTYSQLACTYNIDNQLQCYVTVQVTWYDGMGCGVCGTASTFTVAANSSLPVNCGGMCGTICDIKVVLVDIGGGSPINASVDVSNTSDHGSSTCSMGPPMYSMHWHTGNTEIN